MLSRTVTTGALLASLLATNASAQSAATEREAEINQWAAIVSEEDRDRCTLLADLARLVMSARQEGEDEIRVRSDFANLGPDLIGDIAAEAFDIPRMRESEDQAFIVQQFSAVYELACFRGIAGA